MIKVEQNIAEQSRAEQKIADQSRAEQNRAEQSSCGNNVAVVTSEIYQSASVAAIK